MTDLDFTTNPRRVNAAQYPIESELSSRLRFLLPYAAVAPSSHNTQPWRFAVEEDSVTVTADKNRWLKVADADQRELHISVGCALENLLVAAEHFQFTTDVSYFPDGEVSDEDSNPVIARVSFEENGVPSSFRPPQLFDAILERSTNRQTYDGHPIAPDKWAKLNAVCVEKDIAIENIDDPKVLDQVCRYIARADIEQFANPHWRRELSDWIGQGIFGTSWLTTKLAKFVVKRLDMGERTAKENEEKIKSAPHFVFIVSETDDRRAQVRSGQVFQRFWLMATALDVAVHPMNQMLQIPKLKTQLTRHLSLEDHTPQIGLRVGYTDQEPSPTPRRPLIEMID